MKRTKSLQRRELGYAVSDINGDYAYVTLVSGDVFRYDRNLRAYTNADSPDDTLVLDSVSMLDDMYVTDYNGVTREAFVLQWRRFDGRTIGHEYIEM